MMNTDLRLAIDRCLSHTARAYILVDTGIPEMRKAMPVESNLS